MTTVPRGVTRMADPSSHGPFGEIIKASGPEVRAIAEALRSLIVATHPEFVEVTWPRQGIASYGVGPKKMSEHYAYLAPQGDYVNLGFYHGVALEDPSGLLEGAGKRLRHAKIRTLADARAEGLSRLLKAALLERQTAAGSG
jgi:hypothetical protein